MRPPISRYGNKSSVALEAWKRIGGVQMVIEPMCGSAAFTLARPDTVSAAIINDIEPLIVNALRALKHDPDAVAYFYRQRRLEAPPGQMRGHVREYYFYQQRHLLARRASLAEYLRDENYFHPAAAAMWLLGNNECWHGKFCFLNSSGTMMKAPAPHKFLQKYPLLHNREYREQVSQRLAGVRILCGDWLDAINTAKASGTVAVFLDPVYPIAARNQLYERPYLNHAERVVAWAIANEHSPNLQIALCGELGDYDLPGWSSVAWRSKNGRPESQERIWFNF